MAAMRWTDLPFREIWCVDTEFYPGPGLANGGRDGDASTPLCLVAKELRTGRIIRQWQDEFGPFPPYRLDGDALVIGYLISAEFGTHIALGWGQPAACLDAYAEFRHLTNDGCLKSGDRDRGFYSINGALRYFRLDEIDLARKQATRQRILQGPPFSVQERDDALDYCQDDVDALARLVPALVPTIRSLPHALMRAKYMWAVAHMERRGVPLDLTELNRIISQWDAIRTDLVLELDREYGVYEIDANGVPHWRDERFAAYLRRNRIPWPLRRDGSLDLRAETFKDQARSYRQLDTLRELRASLSKLRLNALKVGCDGRNRTLLGAFGSKTSRNQPSTNQFIFGPAKWIRFLIAPPADIALVHRDYCQEEVQIAAVLSGDEALLAACASGDVYMGIAKRLGFVPEDATGETHPEIRDLFKIVVLSILYGAGPWSLASRTGKCLSEAAEIIARLRGQFRVFEEYTETIIDHAGLDLEISNGFGWWMQCPPEISFRTVRNYPVQSTGAEIMRACCILAERRGIRLVAPVHDAFMAEASPDQIQHISAELDRCMRDASRTILRGYELRTEEQNLLLPGQQFFDKRGAKMWDTVSRLVTKLEERIA
jgi:DNA polymerase family A